MYAVATGDINKSTRFFPFFYFLAPSITSIMRSEQAKSAQSSRDALKKRSSTSAPISLEDLMDKEVQSSSQDGTIRELSVLSNPSNEQSTRSSRKYAFLTTLRISSRFFEHDLPSKRV